MRQSLIPLVMVLLMLMSCNNNQSKMAMNPELSSETQDKSVTLAAVERFNEAVNLQDIEALMDAMTEDCVFENTNPPPDGGRFEGAIEVRSFWEKFFAANPDAFFEVEEIFATGDHCVVRWIYRKTKNGEPWHLRGVDVFKVREGKVSEKMSYVKG